MVYVFFDLLKNYLKKESLSSDQLGVLLTIISRINDEYKRYLKTRKYESIETIIYLFLACHASFIGLLRRMVTAMYLRHGSIASYGSFNKGPFNNAFNVFTLCFDSPSS